MKCFIFVIWDDVYDKNESNEELLNQAQAERVSVYTVQAPPTIPTRPMSLLYQQSRCTQPK